MGLRRAASGGGRRHMGGWLHKNARAEENAGLREASYKTWEFDTKTIPSLFLKMLVPGALFYFICLDELEIKNEQMGTKIKYGVNPDQSAD